MNPIVGIDGCPGGWFFVFQSQKTFKFGVFARLAELVEMCPADTSLFIDCPIGLREASATPRGCDTETRRLLRRPRSSSVFPIPMRAVLDYTDYPSALARHRELSGKGISKQAFGIMPKILELDNLLADSRSSRLSFREIHPELCFWALDHGRAMMHSKKTELGFRERLRLLNQYFPTANNVIDQAMQRYSRKQLSRDDIVDALAAFVTAQAPPSELCTVPTKPERDSRGYAMENVYRLWAKR